MAYDLKEINLRTVADPAAFLAECDAGYAKKISAAADMIVKNLSRSPIVLLSGPSGSGKTTTAQKIEEELRGRGIKTYTISMDNYFRTVDAATDFARHIPVRIIATMLGVPLATCSARLPVYLLLIGMLVPADAMIGPLSGRGVAMFAMYLLGGASAMTASWVVKKITDRTGHLLPFYMEMPPYRIPTLRSVGIAMWEPTKAFLRKAGTIILVVTIAIWALTTIPFRSDAELAAAGVDPTDDVAVTAYTMEHSAAAGIGKAVEPVFRPLGFDWRVDVALVGSLAAREVAVSTLGQMASATDPENDVEVSAQLATWTYSDGPNAGEKVFTPDTVVALLLFFAFALQCMSTIAIMRREAGGWKWPAIAFGYMFVLAYSMAFLGHTITGLFVR